MSSRATTTEIDTCKDPHDAISAARNTIEELAREVEMQLVSVLLEIAKEKIDAYEDPEFEGTS